MDLLGRNTDRLLSPSHCLWLWSTCRCWNKQLINLIIGKFTMLNHWYHLLNVRAFFTVKGHDKADLVSRRPDYPSGRCPPAHACWDVALWWDGKVPDLYYRSNELLSNCGILSSTNYTTEWSCVFTWGWILLKTEFNPSCVSFRKCSQNLLNYKRGNYGFFYWLLIILWPIQFHWWNFLFSDKLSIVINLFFIG